MDREVNILGDAYAIGNKAYEECKMARFEIGQLNQIIYEQQCGIISRKYMGKIPLCKVEGCRYCKNKKYLMLFITRGLIHNGSQKVQ